MAKNDYYVLAYKILAYLYLKLKAGEDIDEKMISADGILCGDIPEKYWCYIMENLADQGYIRGIHIDRTWGKVKIIQDLGSCEITPDGIDYLCSNSLMKKAKEFLKDVKAITPFI